MADVKFFLKNEKIEKTSIYARLHFGYSETNYNGIKVYKSLKFSIGESIEPKYWDKKTMRTCIKTNEKLNCIKYPLHSEFNQTLDNIELTIKDIIRRMKNDGKGDELNPENLKTAIKEQLFKDKKILIPQTKELNFCDFIETIIQETINGIRTDVKTGKTFQSKTAVSYKVALKHLREYQTAKRKVLRFKDITVDFHKDYINFLNNKILGVNTIGGNIKNIKVFMNIAYERGLTDNVDFKKRSFHRISEETQSIYLTVDELQKIYDLDLTNNKRLEQVRDMFIIGCYTGLRFGDLSQLNNEHISDNTITLTTKKTTNKVIIPLHWTVRDILEKYQNNLPRVISNQKMNDYIKEIGELAEIDETIILTKTAGGLRHDKQYKKFELITVHSARRSFATNMYLNEIPTISIMQITGHKTEKAFLKYIKVTPEQNAKKLLLHPFFNRKMKIGG